MRWLPDWGRPVDRESVRLYAPFERDGPPLALPDALTIAVRPDGLPAFHIIAVRALGLGAGGYGRIDLELQLDTAAPDARPVPALRGWLRLRSRMLDVPPELQAPVELDCSGLCLARMTLPLAPEGVVFVERCLEDGALPVLATADLEIAGVAPRPGGTAIIDVGLLRAALAEGRTTPAGLRDRLLVAPAGVGVSLSGVPDAAGSVAVAEAVTDHVRALLCAGPLLPAGDAGLALAPLDPGMAEGRATLDLARPVVATRTVALHLDPFLAARTLAADRGGVGALITRSTGRPLPTGRHRITVDAGLRRPLVGPLAVGATLVFAPRPPGRLQEVRHDFELPADGFGVELEVQLAPSEPLEYTLSGWAFWPTADGRGAERLLSEPVAFSGAQALLRPSAFPLAFHDVEAEASLLAIAEVALRFAGTWSGREAHADAGLSAGQPRVCVALPLDAAEPTMMAELRPRGGGSPIVLGPSPADDWRIELAEVPGYGPRAVEIAVALPEGMPLAAVEVVAEDAADGAPTVYAFTRGAGTRVHRWFCRDPFRPGLLWRWRGTTEFSVPVRGDRLDLTPEGAAPMTDPVPGRRYGTIRAWPDPAEPGGTRWRYLPLAPSPQRTPAGTPQVTLVDAGGTVMLSIGANLGADEAALAAARGEIAAASNAEPRSIELRPGEVSMKRAVLELVPADGAPRQLAQAAPSPVPPYPAAFSAMLQGEDGSKVKAALAGGGGRVRVRYEVELAGSRSVTARIEGTWEEGDDVEALLAEGKLSLVVDADAGVSDTLRKAAKAEVIRAAQDAIDRMAPAPGQGTATGPGVVSTSSSGVAASVTRTEPAPTPLELAADVRDWI